jgi:AraC-like DNA-binding protein
MWNRTGFAILWVVHLIPARPHPALANAVARYTDFADRTASPRESGEAPGGSVVVIIDLDSGWTVEGERYRSFAGGLIDRPVRVRQEGSSEGVQIDLEPPAVRTLLGVPAGELAERTIGLEDLLGPEAERIADRLHGLEPAARFAILDDILRLRLARASAPRTRPDTERAWALLRRSHGRMRIDAVAATLGCSRRHLANRFAEDVGVSPKLAARLIRFEGARRRLGTAPLGRLAAEHGYADQAHLTREFVRLGGAPPTSFPFVQDDSGAPR